MDFIYPLDEETKEGLKNFQFKKIDLYVYSSLDLKLNYSKTHYVITDETLYIIDENFHLLMKFTNQEIEEIKIDNVLNYSRLYIKVNNKIVLIGNIDKTHLKAFFVFQKYGLKVLNQQMCEEDYHSKDIEKSQERICPKCHRPYENDLNYCTHCYGKSKTFFRLLSYIKRYKGAFISIVLLLIFSSIIGVFTPIFTNKILYNEVLDQNGRWFGKILLFVICFLILKIFSMVINILYGRVIAKASANLCFDMKNDVFSAMQRLSLKFFKDKETGNLMNRVVWDVNMVFYFIVDDIPALCINLMQTIGVMVYLLTLRVELAIFAFLIIPVLVVLFVKIRPVFKMNWQQIAARNNELNNAVSDTLEGFRVVKVFSGHEKEVKRFTDISKRTSSAYVKQYRFHQFVYPMIMFIISFAVFVTWGYGGYLVILGTSNGGMDYGDFATFVAGIDLLYTPLESVVNTIFTRIPSTLTSARRIFEIIDANIDVKESVNAIDLKDIKGEIEFKNVSFSYDINQTILKNVSFKVPANTSLGIVGHTGAGKSTLMNLLARLYDVDSGAIYIDGINIKDISFKSLHQNVSMISQDTYLFKGSIYENIKYAKPEATLHEVIQAAKVANAHDFIMKFENGYDTLIGQGATNLSGGERQRISIARAVLLNSKIIIFDEATSAMDTITEKAIQESITKLSKGKTVLMIAHRLSTLKDVDRLIVIEKKGIIEEGSMAELVQLKGKFYELYTIQQEALKHIKVGD